VPCDRNPAYRGDREQQPTSFRRPVCLNFQHRLFFLAGETAAAAGTAQPFTDLSRNLILQPLAMTHARAIRLGPWKYGEAAGNKKRAR